MPEKITINLSESENAKKFDVGQIIHKLELDRAKEYISNLIDSSKRNDTDDYAHRAITILGSRGSGKTTFLLNLEHTYINDTDVKILPVIDPTLIEEKGHAFLNVVSAISELVDKYFNENRFQSNNDDAKRQWNDKLLKLAGGIPSIDGIGNHNSENWMDVEFVMQTGLENVLAARNLKLYFNEFLKESARILSTEVFLLRFDDIDVDSSKGWAVLECIRKYFTSPKLVIVLSGDINLYSTVVRQKKWLNFGKEILKYESKETNNKRGEFNTHDKFKDLVVDLSAQYMLKIMPPKYRIHLTTISEKKRIYGDINMFVRSSAKHQNEEPIEKLYNNILAQYGIVNPTQQESFRTFLLSLPLRSQIQFMTNSSTYLRSADDQIPSISSNDQILDIFISELEEKNVDTNVIKYSSKYINSIILELLISSERLNDVYQLQPVTTDHSMNASLFSLNTVLASSINNQNSKYLIFDYFLKVAYPRNVLHVIPFEKTSDTKENNENPSIEDFCRKSGIYTDRVLRDIAGEMQSYIFGVINNGNTQYTNYFIKLSGLQQKAKRNYTDRLDTVFSEKNDASLVEKTLGYIPGFISTDSGQKTNLSYSIHLLFATIGELLKRDELIAGGQSRPQRLKELKSALINLSQLRAYNAFNFSRGGTVQDKHARQNDMYIDTDEYPVNNVDSYIWDDFANVLLNWFSSRTLMKKPVPAHILGKIFTRFLYALQNIDQNYTRDILLGELFNYQIIAFFNAILIEDTLEQMRNEPGLNMDNTNLSTKIFKKNLNKLNNEKFNTSSLSLSRWLLSCPLLLCYIDKNDIELDQCIKKFISGNTEEYFRFSVFERLNSVEILNSVFKDDGDNEFPVLQNGSPALLKKGREKELINLLRYTYPRFWFDENDQGVITQYNNSIKKYLYRIFGDDDKSSGKIRKFRQYLTENPSEWP
ncbi:hypothetical protein ASG01_15235 [Chryseobacterium sp. Leaf180]|uniref:hypothetical protein n=1 Tax=Chryseobacterium sp. Leaf180 TaxID=1736289 RepID=UPI000701EB54|nr:hypothetical protein [Chryseobacterium sp. Leaf180]KQR94227.1 hypothetical protein ASG01_15235 [Chryseobacterium sp. Leaf180]